MKKTLTAAVAVAALGAGAALLLAPQPASAPQSHSRCVRAPLDGGADCLRKSPDDRTARYFGAGNTFLRREASGSQCEPVPCGSSGE